RGGGVRWARRRGWARRSLLAGAAPRAAAAGGPAPPGEAVPPGPGPEGPAGLGAPERHRPPDGLGTTEGRLGTTEGLGSYPDRGYPQQPARHPGHDRSAGPDSSLAPGRLGGPVVNGPAIADGPSITGRDARRPPGRPPGAARADPLGTLSLHEAGRTGGEPAGPPHRGTGPPGLSAPGLPRPAQARLNPKYTFETFVIGSSNRFAHAAAVA